MLSCIADNNLAVQNLRYKINWNQTTITFTFELHVSVIYIELPITLVISICNEVEFEFCVIHVCQLLSVSIKTFGFAVFYGIARVYTCICSGTLSDNYVVYRIVLKSGWNQWKGRAHVVEGLSCVVYCYGWESSINLSSVVLTSLEPCPGLATWVGGGEVAKES